MKGLYRQTLALAASLWLSTAPTHSAVPVPVATNLQEEGRLALSQQLPILLTFTSLVCSYCEQLEQDFLQPMLLGGDYVAKVIIRKLVLYPGATVIDFNGRSIAASELADRYRVFVTPTLLFVDGNGNELAERMVGINTPELYGGYLDNCIETALLYIRDPQAAARLTGCQLRHIERRDTIFTSAAP
jgi:thioredoxin-related protein